MTATPASLLTWLHDPAGDRGIHVARDGDQWDFLPYADLAAAARRTAADLLDRGVRPDDRVVILEPDVEGFGAAFFGCLIIGTTPVPAAPPSVFQDGDAYARHLSNLVRVSDPAALLTTAELARRVDEWSISGTVAVVDERPGPGAPMAPVPEAGPGRLGLLQFTSGSTGQARGVQISAESLAANIGAIQHWLRMTRDDPTATWLPRFHDMGLIGCFLVPVTIGGDIWAMQPEQFIRQPLRWLRCFGELGARLTATPTFGLAYIVRRVKPASIEGLDLSAWRACIVGAERIDRDVVESLTALLAPAGFRSQAVLPAYGLAEATLAVTGSPLDADVRTLCVATPSIALDAAVEVIDPTATPAEANGGRWVVGCGVPLDDVAVSIADQQGAPLGDGVLGEVVVRGLSVGEGYAPGSSPSASTSFDDGAVHTGDAGFVADGELYVLGRLGDSLKVRGRSVFAEGVEEAVAAEVGIPLTGLGVVLGVLGGLETVAVVVERDPGNGLQPAVDTIGRLAPGARVQVLAGPRGSIPRTTSGKPRRKLLWSQLAAPDHDLTVIYDSEAL